MQCSLIFVRGIVKYSRGFYCTNSKDNYIENCLKDINFYVKQCFIQNNPLNTLGMWPVLFNNY